MSHSDIAQIRERIRLEYAAAKQVFIGFTPTARHAFIASRQKGIEQCFHELTQHMTATEAMNILIQVEQQAESGMPPHDGARDGK